MKNLKELGELISINDATVIGMLIVIVLGMSYIIYKLDKKIESRDSYIREQDRTTLEILSGITTTLKERQDLDRDVKYVVEDVKGEVVEIKNTVGNNNNTLNNVLNIIQTKLFKMN